MDFNPLKKKQPKFSLIDWIDILAERYGWSMEDILNLPIPSFYAIQEEIYRKAEIQQKQMKRK